MYLDDNQAVITDTKNGFLLAIGFQGSGKTALITSLAVNEYKKNKRLILSNYKIGLPYIYIDLPVIINLIKSRELVLIHTYDDGRNYNIGEEYKRITGRLPTSNDDYLNNNIILLDEIHIYFDAYDFLKSENRIISAFASQLRKRNTLLLATTQFILNVSIRLRKQVKYIFDIEKNGYLYQCSISKIDGYYQTEIGNKLLDLRAYYKYYDTNEIITP